jgi:NitT/TauT family transport system substrate-binding protein
LVRAINRAFNDVQANPSEGIDAVMRRNPTLNRDAETERLAIGMRQLINTPESRSVGIGDVDTQRFLRASNQVFNTFELIRQPRMSEIFTRDFLPPRDERNMRTA